MTEIDRTKVCVLIPALNEKRTIGDVIKGIQSQGYHNILVVDGHSTDGTTDIAESLGAKVYIQKAKGKGAAMQEAFALIKEPYILMLDADGTNPPKFADAMVEPLTSGRADHVIGNRLESYEKGALTKLNHFGNVVMNRLFKWAHGVFMTDILSGYRAFTKESVEKMHLTESGFGIETEISSEVVHHNLRFEVVPTYYKKRTGAPTKLKPISDGWKILVAINKYGKMNNPLFYFIFAGAALVIAGVITGIIVLVEWIHGIEHIPLTILTVLLIVVGILAFMLGLLSDMVVAYHREEIIAIEKLSKKIDELKKE